MVLPNQDHVARTCKASSIDGPTGRPTPASFAFRQNDGGGWKDTYLSVNWLEYLHPEDADLPAKFARLREFLLAPHDFLVVKPTKTNVLAAIKVSAIQNSLEGAIATVLECKHEPHGVGDAHSGVYPSPGVHHWPAIGDAPEHLAVQQFLFQSVCHVEAGILTVASEKGPIVSGRG